MRLLFASLVFLLSFLCASAQTTAILDANFEQDLIDQGIDTNGVSGDILDTDAQAVTTLTLGGTAITDITGIEAFINLTDLDLGNNLIANVDLTALTQLINFTTDKNDALASIDFSQNLLLETVWMEGDLGTPGEAPITVIDLSNNINLTTLDIDFLRNVTDLILPVTPTLTDIYLRYLSDTSLDFSLLDGLENLNIGGSSVNGVVITLPNEFTVLKDLRISSIDIPTIDISNYINLESIYFWGTYVENLLLPNSTTLTDIFIILHDIQHVLDFSILPNLEDIDITSNQATPLLVDVTQNLVLTDVDLSNNDMYTIDLTQNILLEDLRLNSNNFTTLDLTQNINLDSLSASYNQLPTLDLTQNVLLEYLYLSHNVLPNLDITQNILLRSVYIDNNLFTTTGLDLTQNVELYSFVAHHNQIESLDITQNIELSYIDVSYNLFSGTSIMDQFYTIRLNDNGINGGAFIANYNQLHGLVPDFVSLVEQNHGTPIGFDFVIDNNNIEFGHIEDQHNNLVIQDNTPGPAPSWTWMDNIEDYFYAPQAKVDVVETINANAGDSITLTTICSGTQNHYAWYKDGVLIPDAPDSWEYTIPSVNSCDEGVYYSEITSDLVPFENTNPPGTGNKNLLLIRNDITLNVTSPVEECVNLTTPINGSIDVALNEVLNWSESIGACGYYISIGTTSGGTDILNNADVGDVESYALGTNLPPNTEIFVTITPYFFNGTVLNCTEESFTTGTDINPVACTVLNSPQDGDINVAVNSNISWDEVPGAIGYFISIGTTSGGTEIENMYDVGNITSYTPSTDLPDGTTIYVTIIPYDTLGNATGCSEESFTTEILAVIPLCTTITLPMDGDTNVAVNTNINWDISVDASGYIISLGTTSGGTDIANNVDVGNVTTYNPTSDLPENTTIYITVTPYSILGNAVGCVEESFTTEILPPPCTNLNTPINGETNVSVSSDLSLDLVTNATGYILSVGTTSGGTEILNNVDVGNNLTYSFTSDLPENTEIFVIIIPYNAAGNATACSEESFTTEVLPTTCTALNNPINGTVNVPITTDIAWNTVVNATGYILSVGTAAGGTDIVNNEDVGNSSIYNFSSDLPENTEIFVSVIPYNSLGNASGCIEESFTTEVLPTTCTSLLSPLDGETNVALDTNISWNAVTNATGYMLSIGTISGGTDILNNVDVGNVTIYNMVGNFNENETIYVSVIPYNSIGNATGCTEASFTTEILLPSCAQISSPFNGETNVALDTDISWSASVNTVGYTIALGTTSGADDILTTTDLGNTTSFNPDFNLPNDTEIFVTITAYNAFGNEANCGSQQFTTIATPPDCTQLISPLSESENVSVLTHLEWETSAGATGYILNVSVQSSGINLVYNYDVGNTTFYDYNGVLPEGSEVVVKITPYNSIGEAVDCNEEHFFTELNTPSCTALVSPSNNQTSVSIDTSIAWSVVEYASGYYISIGSDSFNDNLLDMLDVGNTTSYLPDFDLPENSIINISIVPYNDAGMAENCSTMQFTTELLPPDCTYLISPFNLDSEVDNNTVLYWSSVESASGYYVNIGTTSTGNDIANNYDVGNNTMFSPLLPFNDGENIFVTIIPYNESGEALNCNEEMFTIAVSTLNIPKFFTPNGDTQNDFWTVTDPRNEVKQITIFNRYGKLLKVINGSGSWDGVHKGKMLPTDDYWYVIELVGAESIAGHFTLKR